MKEERGLLIVLEGPDDCGKSTLAKMAVEKLDGLGYYTTHLRDPGGAEFSEHIRRIILDPKSEYDLDSLDRALGFGLSKSYFVRKKLKPALDEGRVAVVERFTLSTQAYQGYGDGLDHDDIKALCKMVSRGVKPDLTLLLKTRQSFDMSTLNTKEFRGEPDVFEAKGPEFQKRVWQGYTELQSRDPENIKIIDYLDLNDGVKPDEAKLEFYRKVRLEMMFNYITPLLHKYEKNINRKLRVGSAS